MDPFDQVSSTPVIRRPVRESLAAIKQNTVAGIVNRFNQITECTAGRQVPFVSDFSSINQAPVSGIDSKWNSADSGYESFRRRTKSVSSINQSQSLMAKYESYPNFKFDYLKYFGVDPKEYLSTFGIDYDSYCNDSPGRKRNGDSSVTNNLNISVMRNRSFTSKRPFDSTVVKVDNVKYFGLETSEGPMRVATVLNNNSSSKVAAKRNAFLKKSQRSIAAQTPQWNLDSVDSDVEGKTAPKSTKPPKRSHKTTVNNDLKSRIEKSIRSYGNLLKAANKK